MTELWRKDLTTLTDAELKSILQLAWDQTASNKNYQGVALITIAEINRRENKRALQINLFISGIAIVIALTSIILTCMSIHGDSKWQDGQLSVLKEINTNLITQR